MYSHVWTNGLDYRTNLNAPRLNVGLLVLPFLMLSSACFSSTEEVVAQFIQDQFKDPQSGMFSDIEHGQLKSFVITSENNISVLWHYGVANYWEYRITSLTTDGITYTENATLKIPGVTESVELEDEVLIIKYLDYSPDDPRCCPSISNTKYYKVTDVGYLELE